MNSIEVFSRALFLQINGGDGTPTWLIQIAIGIADDLIYLIPLLLLGKNYLSSRTITLGLWLDCTR